MRTIQALLFLLVAGGASASQAEVDRLTEELAKRAQNGQWAGAERAFEQLQQLGEPTAEQWWLGAQAAANLGNAATAYRRILFAERASLGVTDGSFYAYLETYGRVEVRRLDKSCITLEPLEPPFDPVHKAAIEFAANELATTGGFYGILPAGSYRVGPYQLDVLGGPGQAILARTKGDGNCK